MIEESLPSIWASMHSWFTPTVLFILINVVIGTIAFSSSQKQENRTNLNRHLPRTSILQRLRSFSLQRQKMEETPPTSTTLELQTTNIIETIEAVELPSDSLDDEFHFTGNQFNRHPTAEEVPQQKMKRSASAKPKLEVFEREDEMVVPEVHMPATMRERKTIGDEDEVDARADDFINKFKQQLKLQRMESILRSREPRSANR